MKLLNYTPKKFKFCQKFGQIWSNFVKSSRNFVKFTQKYKKKAFFAAKILIFFFLQNPVSGPLKRHDGG